MAKDIMETINDNLMETEKLANEFLPLRDVLTPIQQDFKTALETLKTNANNSVDVADKVFYINRYTDLIKKMESVFDTRSKRLQQTMSMLTKMSLDNLKVEQTETEEKDNNGNHISPEQANELLKILNNINETK